jgi:hypothetical protein
MLAAAAREMATSCSPEPPDTPTPTTISPSIWIGTPPCRHILPEEKAPAKLIVLVWSSKTLPSHEWLRDIEMHP